ncbi:MAG: YciI family protein [Chloroflexota bacterium]
MNQVILLLRTPPIDPESFSPATFETLVAEIVAWHEKLENDVVVINSGQLHKGTGKHVRRQKGQIVVDGPYSETKELLSGFFLIETETLEAAVAIAKSCPILSFGGSVEVVPYDCEPLGA